MYHVMTCDLVQRLCMVCVEKIRDPELGGNNKCPLDKQIIMEVIRVNT